MIRLAFIISGVKRRLIVQVSEGKKKVRLRTPIYYCTVETKNKYRRDLYALYDSRSEHSYEAMCECVREANHLVLRRLGENYVANL